MKKSLDEFKRRGLLTQIKLNGADDAARDERQQIVDRPEDGADDRHSDNALRVTE